MQLLERLARLRGSTAAPSDRKEKDQFEASRSEADALLSAADQVIDRTLSGNSEAFLTDCIQDGGQ